MPTIVTFTDNDNECTETKEEKDQWVNSINQIVTEEYKRSKNRKKQAFLERLNELRIARWVLQPFDIITVNVVHQYVCSYEQETSKASHFAATPSFCKDVRPSYTTRYDKC